MMHAVTRRKARIVLPLTVRSRFYCVYGGLYRAKLVRCSIDKFVLLGYSIGECNTGEDRFFPFEHASDSERLGTRLDDVA